MYHIQKAILAGGCFWGMQELMRQLEGVTSTRVGYTGGRVSHATYTNHAGHAEALEISFDSSLLSYREILEYFFQIHDPCTKNRQGMDIGDSYRSAIFYLDEAQKKEAEGLIALINSKRIHSTPIITTLEKASEFWEAEEEHQDYLQKHPRGYTCHFVREDWKL